MGEFTNLGEIVKAVGLKGEVKLLPGTGFWADALKGEGIYLVSSDIIRRLVKVEKFRKKGGTYVIKLDSIGSIEDAELAVGKRLELSMDEVELVPPERGLAGRFTGMKMFLKNGELLGDVVGIFESGGQDRLIVKGKRSFMIPYVPSIVIKVDYDNGRIEIDPPEGLLELEW
jgi:16S rRNA processing protein RimM